MDHVNNLPNCVETLEHPAHTSGDRMRSLTVLLTVVLALWMGFQASGVDAQPTRITKCQTISEAGSYMLANNLIAAGNCLVIAEDFVTIDLAGFSIRGNGTGTGIGV